MPNRLTKIYTRMGDDGMTELSDHKRVDKSDTRIEAMGDIDELNSIIGLLIANDVSKNISSYLLNIQHRLFDIGAELAIPGNIIISQESIEKLEELIDNFNSELPALKEFVLPGGSLSASICHVARTVCRRSERTLVRLARTESFNSETLRYINRLSDLLFVFARALNQNGKDKEVLWDSNRLKHSV
tara:strand:+ start:9039 stop:9599 length:561 start_codon:yes stop_codon:yes gene_type:complete